MNDIRQNIKTLRLELLQRNLDAMYISGTDPHSGEYLTDHWQIRAFISGFTGTSGIVVITQEEAGLWTDSRYFLQAADQLKGSGIKMYKLRVPDAVIPEIWLSKKLPPGSKVGFDPRTLTVSGYRALNNSLEPAGIIMIETPDIIDKIWQNRPELPNDEIYEFPTEYAGSSRKNKRELVCNELKKLDADIQIITTTDEVAWLFNLRGSDVKYNPVFTGFGVIGKGVCILFTDNAKIPSPLKIKLEKEKIKLLEYAEFYTWLKSVKESNIYIDPSAANYAVFKTVCADNQIIEGLSVISLLKAVKNPVELRGFRQAVKKDSVALTEFLYWLKQNLQSGEITEYTAGIKMAEFRSLQSGYKGESFAPIAGYKEHGAVVHYCAIEREALTLREDGILLFDSGGHYLNGTTDITRTVALGPVTERQRSDFTYVLKGLIALSEAVFPQGTRGWQIDALARTALWKNGLNYGHGTGHGIGHFLNVHEGPVSIRHDCSEIPLSSGMVFSNEPGLYREEEYGIRIENILECVKKEETEFGTFLGFETLTLFPVDINLIETKLLNGEEKKWINRYHKRVNAEIKPLLRKELHKFFDSLTTEID
jgi:Xaa-Pro aminopeptidase